MQKSISQENHALIMVPAHRTLKLSLQNCSQLQRTHYSASRTVLTIIFECGCDFISFG